MKNISISEDLQRRLEDYIATYMLLTSRWLVIVFKDYSWSLFIVTHLFEEKRKKVFWWTIEKVFFFSAMAVFSLLFRGSNVFEAVQFYPVFYAIKPLPLKTMNLSQSFVSSSVNWISIFGSNVYCLEICGH